MAEDMIGRTFGEYNQLEVVGIYEKEKGKPLKYQLVCSVCGENETFSGEIYTSTRTKLVNGNLPCNCARVCKRLTEAQQTRRVMKECQPRGVEFLGFVGEFKHTKTKMLLRCLKDGHEWDTINIDNFFGGRGCPKCAITSRSIQRAQPEDEAIRGFVATGSFVEGTCFWRSCESSLNKWKYRCPICSADEFVQQGLCSGVFTTNTGGLSKGRISCRCSKCYRFTPEQREYQIQKKIKDEGLHYIFLGWKSEWRGFLTTIHMYCEDHGDFFPSIKSFVNEGSRCASCSKTGFDANKDAFVYVLKASGICGDFTGYGITSNATKRLREHTTRLEREGFSVTEHRTFSVSGGEALRIEKAIKKNFTLYRQEIIGFKTEATYYNQYSNVIDFILSNISS